MSILRTVAVSLLAVLMVTTVIGASSVLAVDRTVLNSEQVSTTFEKEGAQAAMTTQAREQVATELNTTLQGEELPEGITIDGEGERIAEQVITESYVNQELTRNIEAIIAFLEGRANELALEMNAEPIKQSLAEQFDDEAVTVDTVTLAQNGDFGTAESDVEITDEMIARLNEDQTGYRSVRLEIRSNQIDGLPVGIEDDESVAVDTVAVAKEIDFETSDIEVTDQMIEDSNRDAEGYAATRSTIRQQVRDQAPPRTSPEQIDQRLREINTELKADAEQQARANYGGNVSEDSLENIIALQNTIIDGLIDPDLDDFGEYATRRDTDERELEASLTAGLNQRLREASAEVQSEAAAQAESRYGEQVGNETLQAIIDLQNTVIRGFLDPDLQSEYESQRDANEMALESAIGSEIQQRIDGEVNDTIAFGDDLTENNGQVETVQSGIGLIGTLVFVLPLLFVGLAGLVYGVTRSIRRTLSTAGYTLIVGGIIGAVLGLVLVGRIVGALDSAASGGSEAETTFADAFAALVRLLFDTHVMQSALLAVLGIILVVAVYVERNGYLDSVRS